MTPVHPYMTTCPLFYHSIPLSLRTSIVFKNIYNFFVIIPTNLTFESKKQMKLFIFLPIFLMPINLNKKNNIKYFLYEAI